MKTTSLVLKWQFHRLIRFYFSGVVDDEISVYVKAECVIFIVHDSASLKACMPQGIILGLILFHFTCNNNFVTSIKLAQICSLGGKQ